MAISEDNMVRLLLKEQPRLLAFLYALVRRAEVADDLFQDVSLEAVRARTTLESEEHFTRWVYRVARNRAIDELRRTKLPSLDSRVLDFFESNWTEHAVSDYSERVEALRSCIKQLKPAARDLLSLRYKNELAVKSVASAVKRTPEAIYMELSRIRKQLRHCIEWRLRRGEEKGVGDELA